MSVEVKGLRGISRFRVEDSLANGRISGAEADDLIREAKTSSTANSVEDLRSLLKKEGDRFAPSARRKVSEFIAAWDAANPAPSTGNTRRPSQVEVRQSNTPVALRAERASGGIPLPREMIKLAARSASERTDDARHFATRAGVTQVADYREGCIGLRELKFLGADWLASNGELNPEFLRNVAATAEAKVSARVKNVSWEISLNPMDWAELDIRAAPTLENARLFIRAARAMGEDPGLIRIGGRALKSLKQSDFGADGRLLQTDARWQELRRNEHLPV